MPRTRYYHGTSKRRWESIRMDAGFIVLPVYLTTREDVAAHYAKSRAAADDDSEYAVIKIALYPDKVLVDSYSSQEPDQYKLFRPLHRATFYSQYFRVETAPMPTDQTELLTLKAFAIGMNQGEERLLAPGFNYLKKKV